MDPGKLIGDLTKDWEWLSFLAQYCAGRNIGKAFCGEVRWWALGIVAAAILLVVWWVTARVARAYERWSFRRRSARVADAGTMKEHVWSGHDAHLTASDQRARRKDQPPR